MPKPQEQMRPPEEQNKAGLMLEQMGTERIAAIQKNIGMEKWLELREQFGDDDADGLRQALEAIEQEKE